MLSKTVLASVLVAASASVSAQGVHTRQQLSAALANELVGETVALCASRGYKVWAVVVNLDGVRTRPHREQHHGNGRPHGQGRANDGTADAAAERDVRAGRHRDPERR